MSLTSGSRLGAYEILGPLGAGGMGEVYRARDTKLGREVAIKVLPQTFSQDPERLARFQREAHLLASLNHPNVATIHGLEESNGQQFLVMELVEGETLAERLSRGPMRIEEALALFVHIAEGLEAAHEKGIIHRDLKPSNIKLTPDGRPKILDFGLAKALAGEPVVQDLSQSPTLTRDATETGVLLGTAAYMSPEQARGKPVDKRTDIWAFGCCLYEALTGEAAFLGETVSDSIGKILEREPDWDALPSNLPALGRSLLHRCLRKDLGARCRDIGDARLELSEAAAASMEEATPAAKGGGQNRRFVLSVSLGSVLAALVGGWWLGVRDSRKAGPVTRVTASLPPMASIDLSAYGARRGLIVLLSPDGQQMVFAKPAGRTPNQLYLRSMDQLGFAPISGTEGSIAPFLSTDGDWLGFFTQAELKKISVRGGTPVTLCEVPGGAILGGSWGPAGSIVFATEESGGLLRVSSSGGVPERLSELREGERYHQWPDVLPGGKAALLSVLFDTSDRADEGQIEVLDLSTGERRKVIDGGTYARYSPSGHVLFAREQRLYAVPFDLDRLAVTGAPASVLEGVQMDPMFGAASFAVSMNGTLVHIPGAPAMRALVEVDTRGRTTPLPVEPGPFLDLRLSPDGRRVAFTKGISNHNVWIYEVPRRSLMQLTRDSDHHNPVWSPEGKYLAFDRAHPPNLRDLVMKRADGLGPTEPILASDQASIFPGSWSPDGRYMAYAHGEPRRSLWVLPMEGERQPRCVLDADRIDPVMNVWEPIFSPDGRWIAYLDTGRGTIDVIDYPEADRRETIAEGERPIWHPTGKGLFYQKDGKMMFVEIGTETFTVGEPRVLFEDEYLSLDYDVTPDGEHFYMIREAELPVPSHVNVTLNWHEELKRLVPTEK